ncbi:MAG: thioredoxin fold domain-containing protein [Planctomycetota bacterium]
MHASLVTPNTPSPPGLGRRVVRWGMVVLVGLGLALTIDLARSALAADRVAWGTLKLEADRVIPVAAPLVDLPPASSQDPSRPRLIRFTADWCGPCETMKSQVFAKATVADTIHARFDAYSVDLSHPTAHQEALGQRYRVVYLPTLLITDADGRELARLDQAAGAAEFLDWLNRGWQRWNATKATPSTTEGSIVSPIANPKRVN